MGLDVGRAHWSYSGFNRFRKRLASVEGFDLDNMAGFERFGVPSESRSWDTITTALAPLLYHSDCDGELTPDECRQVAPRLAEIIAVWPDDHDRQQATLLVEDMLECAESGDPLEFW